jgi:hypothetical protein
MLGREREREREKERERERERKRKRKKKKECSLGFSGCSWMIICVIQVIKAGAHKTM